MATNLTKPLECYPVEKLEQASMVKDCNDNIAKRTFDECSIAKLQEVIEAIENISTGPGGGGIECQEQVIDLTANTWVTVPHTFTSKVCDVKTYDSLGTEIEIVSRKIGTLLELCSTVSLTNVLVIIEGE